MSNTRVYTSEIDEAPKINQDKVIDFFNQRAQKVKDVGYKQAVIYQDKNPELAEARDKAEKELLLPKFKLSGSERVLDIGCGTGRWAEVLVDKVNCYLGVDATQGLVDVASEKFSSSIMEFKCLKAEEVTLSSIEQKLKFDRILNLGVMIYLNDLSLEQYISQIPDLLASSGMLIVREPVAVDKRLTLNMHYSEDMEQSYSAIYRTEKELMSLFNKYLIPYGIKLFDRGFVFQDGNLNHRAETIMKYFILKKH